jgi:hypothetical protein
MRIFNYFTLISIVSLLLEGFVVYILNGGDCPLIHVQKRVNDPKPFFELFLPKRLARLAIPIFSVITGIGIFLLLIRFIFLTFPRCYN